MTRKFKNRRENFSPISIPEKANLVLNCIMVGLLIIALRIWHLQFSQYDEKFEESKKPQRKSAIESAKRATIRDRFNIPLAVNKITYRASVAYAPIRAVPTAVWELDGQGKRIKRFARKEYIKNLSILLGKELNLDEERVEDLIYAKAALFYTIPYVIKDEISEVEYARLKMLEKDWPGLVVERHFKREYPKGKCACDIVGYLGAISKEEHESIIRELKGLKNYLNDWENGGGEVPPPGYQSAREVMKRVQELEELAYSAKDFVGKTGIEALFEEELRGYQGKKSYYTDSKGHFLKALPGAREALPGKRALLSISQELQEYAEALLAQNEEIRITKTSGHGVKVSNQKQPWIKGGGIVVMEPSTGEILTLASYPRFDPNDFIPSGNEEESSQKHARIRQWFESDSHIADLWDGRMPLQRERYNAESGQFYLDEKPLSWSFFLELILPEKHPILTWFKQEGTLQSVYKQIKNTEEPFKGTTYTKLLFKDLCNLAIDADRFSPALLAAVGSLTIDEQRAAENAFAALKDAVKIRARTLFHELVFKPWRQKNEKNFLKEKREIEKLTKSYPKPYLDYLDEKEGELFARFWEKAHMDLILALSQGSLPKQTQIKPFVDDFILLHRELEQGAHPGISWIESYKLLKNRLSSLPHSTAKEFLLTMRSFKDLTRPLLGKYKGLRNKETGPLEKHLAAAFYPKYGFGYGRSNGFRQAATQGSIFKLITAYEALIQENEEELQKGAKMRHFNPLNITDRVFKGNNQTYVGLNTANKPIPQLYKGGRIPRSSKANLGPLDLKQAIATSSNVYFSLLAGDVLHSPNDLVDAAKLFGYGTKTGIDLPGEIAGRLPKDLETNRTGLYATAIGQHSLVVTPLQTAVMLSSIVNGGEILKPQIVHALAGVSENKDDEWFTPRGPYPRQNALQTLGIDFPLFIPQKHSFKKGVVEKQIKIVSKTVPMPKELKDFLCDAMYHVVLKTHAESLWSLSKLYSSHPEAISDYIDLKNQLIGKTSTSEQMERIDLDETEGYNLYTHVWFGGISFEEDVNRSFNRPELVVVVYLKFGAYGKEAAPLAAQIVHKWREIKKTHEKAN